VSSNLIAKLKQIKDFRTSDGQRHPLWLVLLIVLMGTMSGYIGYRALGDFVSRHHSALIETLKIRKKRLPSYSTIRRVMMSIDFGEFVDLFNQWAACEVEIEKNDWLAIDGKSIKGTVTQTFNQYQNFVSIVSAFSQQQGVVVSLAKLDNKKGSEIQTVQTLIQALQLEGVIFSLDALHCHKKPRKRLLIVAMTT
jgi:DDE_Tnp_1-associated